MVRCSTSKDHHHSEKLFAETLIADIVAMRLISCLERLLGKGSSKSLATSIYPQMETRTKPSGQDSDRNTDGQNDLLIVSTLDLIQGILLLHPPSRSLFAREIYMNVRPGTPIHLTTKTDNNQLLLDLLDPSNCPAIQSATLLTLVVALLDRPRNTRTFETLDGLLTVTSLFKMRATSREVKLKLIEFLYFYLMPEAPLPALTSVSAPTTALPHRSPSKVGRGGGGPQSRSVNNVGPEGSHYCPDTKTMEEKQGLLGRYLSNVEDLVDDLRDNAPFGGTVY